MEISRGRANWAKTPKLPCVQKGHALTDAERIFRQEEVASIESVTNIKFEVDASANQHGDNSLC